MEKYIVILSNSENTRTDNSYKNLVDKIQSKQSRKVYHALPPHVLLFDFEGNNSTVSQELNSCVDPGDDALLLQIHPSFMGKFKNPDKLKQLKDFYRSLAA
jgi:hypothetical protein